MTRDEQRQKITLFLNETPDPELDSSIHEALYALSELHMFPDNVDSVGLGQAIMCWKLIERLSVVHGLFLNRHGSFPTELCM